MSKQFSQVLREYFQPKLAIRVLTVGFPFKGWIQLLRKLKPLVSINIRVNSCISFQMFLFAKQSRLIPDSYKEKNLSRKSPNMATMRESISGTTDMGSIWSRSKPWQQRDSLPVPQSCPAWPLWGHPNSCNTVLERKVSWKSLM